MDRSAKIVLSVILLIILFVFSSLFYWIVLSPYFFYINLENQLFESYDTDLGGAVAWLENNAEEGEVVLAWWDYGEYLEERTETTAYLIDFADDIKVTKTIGECHPRPLEYQLQHDPLNLYMCNGPLTSLVDREPKGDAEKILSISRLLTSIPPEKQEENLNKTFDYVLIPRIDMTYKWGAITFLGDNNCIPNSELKKAGLSFPELAALTEQNRICAGSVKCPSGFKCTFSGLMRSINCQPDPEEKTVTCRLFQGVPLHFTEEEWEEVVNAPWPGYDLQVEGMSQPIKVYGQSDYKLVFFILGSEVLPDAPVNYMLGPRLFFKDPSLAGLELVHSDEKVVLYKVL